MTRSQPTSRCPRADKYVRDRDHGLSYGAPSCLLLNLAGLIVGARESACRPMPRPRFRPDIGLEFPARSPVRAAVQLPSICKTYADLGRATPCKQSTIVRDPAGMVTTQTSTSRSRDSARKAGRVATLRPRPPTSGASVTENSKDPSTMYRRAPVGPPTDESVPTSATRWSGRL